jgi:hypothetical protein
MRLTERQIKLLNGLLDDEDSRIKRTDVPDWYRKQMLGEIKDLRGKLNYVAPSEEVVLIPDADKRRTVKNLFENLILSHEDWTENHRITPHGRLNRDLLALFIFFDDEIGIIG